MSEVAGRTMKQVTDFFRKNAKVVGITVGVLVVLYVVYILFFRSEGFEDTASMDVDDGERKPDEGFYAEEVVIEEAKTDDDSKKRVVLFYAPWCPHCKSMLEGDRAVWPAFANRFRRHPMVRVDQVNCDEKPDLAQKYKIKGFPTVIMFHKGKQYVYDGDRSLESLEKFVSESK